MEITTVPINYINSVVNAAVLRGCDADKILNHCGIAPELLSQKRARVAAATFSELSDIFRAFKRWTGVTPRAYIKRDVAS